MKEIKYRTFVESKGKVKVIVFDIDGSLKNNFLSFSKAYGSKLKYYTGKGEFIGGQTRAEGRRIFKNITDEYEKRRMGGVEFWKRGEKLPDRFRFIEEKGQRTSVPPSFPLRLPTALLTSPLPEKLSTSIVQPFEVKESVAAAQQNLREAIEKVGAEADPLSGMRKVYVFLK